MEYRKLGRTGLLVSRICLGTMTFGGDGFWRAIGDLPQDDVNDLVKTAFEQGVNFFDTANVYSNGLSELMLGKAIDDLGLCRDEIVVASKVLARVEDLVPPDADANAKTDAERRSSARNLNGLSRKHIFEAVEDSLDRLGLDYLDLYQVHGVDPLTPIEETVEALNDLVRAGIVRYVGLCNMPAWQIMKAVAYAENNRMARFESAQMYYSIAGRDLEREIVPLAKDQDLAILPWSPLAGGFLSGKFRKDEDGPAGARRTSFDFPPVDLDRGWAVIEAMREVAAAHDVSVARIALSWLLHQQHVTSVIIGAKNTDQLLDNIAATQVSLSADELARLNAVSALPAEYPGWMLERQSEYRLAQAS